MKGTGWRPDSYTKVKSLEADIVNCTGGKSPVMVVESVKPMTMRVLPRGNWQNESGETVHPSIPAFLPGVDKLNSRLLEALNDSGALYLTQNLVNGAYTIRLSIGQTSTERRHVEAAWQRIQETARSLP